MLLGTRKNVGSRSGRKVVSFSAFKKPKFKRKTQKPNGIPNFRNLLSGLKK
ncbi:hypothetical protein LEP1GSC171_2892 [Leptospira santarosai str. HAI1380]|nr:hypothetical protein LEP1GSC005_2498 [Leptospira santarosai str. ST188]EMJ48504.1 hypothetical protein LEP1GSC169_0310 [Leptospira santarosai str. HAI1349]EMP03010.1 hypothetical protein LEP1GSC171_2892 [Leptospira santarosai str. HAI1380]EMP80364.1 hypothetical protein LEP1GSC162_3413 [Leptospira santarosai str. CBC1531]